MTFGEKIRTERKRMKISQDDLAAAVGVSRRTINSWENDRLFPRKRSTYDKLAEVLNVPAVYLINEDQSFVIDASEKYGYRGKLEAAQLVSELTGLFAGGEMPEEDMDTLMFAVQEAYVEAKKRNKKYTPKKYLKGDDE